MAITKLNLNGTTYSLIPPADSDIQVYQGRELSDFSWAQIKTKITNGDYSDLRIGDYKTVTLTGGTIVKMQIAGINTYYGFGDSNYILGRHIDFISDKVFYATNVRWNTSSNNNGTSTEKSPYMNSSIRTYLLNTLLPKLPTDLQNVITSKRMLMETRYNASGTLTDSTGWEWKDLGKLWLPTEYEVFGSVIWGTKGFSSVGAIQYPLFANSAFHRLKNDSEDSTKRRKWWLANPISNSNFQICAVDEYGRASIASNVNYNACPICFRIVA